MSVPFAARQPFRWTRSALWLGALNLLVVIGFCAVSAFMLWQMRLDAARRSEITSRSLVHVLGRDIARNIELYDLSLRAVVDGMKRPDVMQATPELRHLILFDRATSATGFAYVLVVDRDGNVVANSQTLGSMSLNVGDREYFRHFAAGVDDGLHISAPVVSRVSGQSNLALSRRLSKPDGSFAGVVTGGIRLDYFHNLFKMAGADRAETVTLYGPGGTIVMRQPFEAHQLGTSMEHTSSYRRVMSAKSGSFIGPAMLGEGERHFVFAQVGDYPLQLSTSVAPAQVYADWQNKAVGLGIVVLGLCGTTVVLTWLFGRELSHRRRSEQVTAALNIELERMATTDALTGLANRRRFDEVLAREWRRSARTQQPLSLILLDADYFKGFNDRYGHQKGDEALKLIARSIESATAPIHDIACRIGGEEFAVILPDTYTVGAKIVAERIREAVSGWKEPHAESPHGVLTISAGLAQIPQMRAVDPVALIACADRALYEAKAGGRNQVRIAGRSEVGLRAAPGSQTG
ncbi:diguanylate cyclase [Methylobacterium sp. R2-1]|uniref:GGDEF domain-containing protein n=1 Tax=Methylobacterium sp. R2-1 TaxID=2587064 RepID=UPI0016163764|nr:sensor domain-containing diguanylate cyclase [Methylobacterium sp. R2-1]MBB2961910.1 diguanylate cyclase (GGDEF)-like protein [Methylobacterium sp. R2-1]